MTAGSPIKGPVGSWPALVFLSAAGKEASVCWIHPDLKEGICELEDPSILKTPWAHNRPDLNILEKSASVSPSSPTTH